MNDLYRVLTAEALKLKRTLALRLAIGGANPLTGFAQLSLTIWTIVMFPLYAALAAALLRCFRPPLRDDLPRSGPRLLRGRAPVLHSDVDPSPLAKLSPRHRRRHRSPLPHVHRSPSRRRILRKSLPLVPSRIGDGACQSVSSSRRSLGSPRGRHRRRSRMLGLIAARVLLTDRHEITTSKRRHRSLTVTAR